MFKILKKVKLKNKKESKWFDEEYEILEALEEIEEPIGEIIYRNSSKILIVTEKNHIDDKDNTEWFRGTIKIDKVQNYLKHMDIQKGDLVEVYYKESVRNNEVIDREIQSIIKIEDVSYDIKTQISKVKKVYKAGGFSKGIEFEDGSTYSEFRYLKISIPNPEDETRIYRETFMYEGDLCKHTYLEILKNGDNKRNTITVKAEKIDEDFIDNNRNEWLTSSYEDVKSILEEPNRYNASLDLSPIIAFLNEE